VYTTEEKLDLVREAMAAADIQAFIVPRADEYLGEYVPEHNERLQWISGFSGSAGMAIILVDRAAIFVDGRYTIQVKQQVSSELYEYHHLIDETPIAWLKKQLTSGRVGIDSRLHSYKWFKDTRAVCSAAGLSLLELTSNPIDDNWHDRPVPERQLATLLDSQFTGEPSSAKRQRIGAAIKTAGANVALITQLDSIAWLLNIRGNDVPRLPVLLATATLKSDGSMTLFTDPAKIPNDFSRHVGDGVTVEDQANISAALRSLAEQNVLTDPGNTNAFTRSGCEADRSRRSSVVAKSSKKPC
jgi:Xaa-Pro aminopeptidase